VEKNSARKLDKIAKSIKAEHSIQQKFIRATEKSIQNKTNFRLVYTYRKVAEINRKLKIINEEIYFSVGHFETNIEAVRRLRQEKKVLLDELRKKENVRKTKRTKGSK
jgi:hypothetical protein